MGIGGVMGGASSEIDAATTRVLLEAAYFVPMAIARTSKRLQPADRGLGPVRAGLRPGRHRPGRRTGSASCWP